MSSITLDNVKKAFDEEVVIPNLNLKIEDGSFTVLVGPSGCGKSTILRMIAGLETPSSGQIFIDDEDVVNLSPGKRGIAMVFQNYALYPTMTVKQNIEFGLSNQKIVRAERERRIKEVCEIVGLEPYLKRKPGQLSGGQRQRVAVARAMVKQPKVFLMDEPLSNLDAKLRAAMRVELIQLHKRLRATFIYVTHDQVEAMSMGDNIVLINKGIIMQRSSPRDMYNDPQNVFTAQFIGAPPMNIVRNLLPSDVSLGFRPEKIVINPSTSNDMEILCIKGHIMTKEHLGSEINYSISTQYGQIMAKLEQDVSDDSDVIIGVRYDNLYIFDQDDNRTELNSYIKKILAEISVR